MALNKMCLIWVNQGSNAGIQPSLEYFGIQFKITIQKWITPLGPCPFFKRREISAVF